MIKKYKQFNEGIKNLLVGPTKEEVSNDLKNKYENGEITLNTYLRKCNEFGLPKPDKYDVLMTFGITNKKINTGQDFITFIINKTEKEYNYINKNIVLYKLHNVTYFGINEKEELCMVSRENIYDVLDIFGITATEDKLDLLEIIFKEKGFIKRGWKLNIRENKYMFLR